MRKVVQDEKLRKSLTMATGRIWSKYKDELKEGDVKDTKKYKYKFRFRDKGPHFRVTDKSTGIEYFVEAYEDWWIMGEGVRLWGAYHT